MNCLNCQHEVEVFNRKIFHRFGRNTCWHENCECVEPSADITFPERKASTYVRKKVDIIKQYELKGQKFGWFKPEDSFKYHYYRPNKRLVLQTACQSYYHPKGLINDASFEADQICKKCFTWCQKNNIKIPIIVLK